MNYTFFLKHPQRKEIDSNKPTYETLILFSYYFKYESKKFVFSIGEKINPKNWNKEVKYPIERGKNNDPHVSSIIMQLDRYKNTFKETEVNCIKTKEEFTSKLLKIVLCAEDYRSHISYRQIIFIIISKNKFLLQIQIVL